MSRRDLERHQTSRNRCPPIYTKKDKPIKCHLCESSFRRNEYMKKHLIRCHFKCHLCGEFFRHKTELSRHLTAHAEDRSDGTEQAKKSSYRCYYCPLAFSTKGSLSSHEFVHTDPNYSIIYFEKEA